MSGIIAQNSGRHTGLVKAASAAGVWTLISTLTSDGSDADLTFDSGIDSTYDEYAFKFTNMHPETDEVNFKVNFRDGSTAYDATKTTTFFKAYHAEDDAGAGLVYEASDDMAQSTSSAFLSSVVDNDNDAHLCGELHLFAPSDTTFVKHFFYTGVCLGSTKYLYNDFVAGYCNVTAAIDGVQFTYDDGNMDTGTISMYGIT